MFRGLLLIGAFLLFRAALRREPQWSSKVDTHYISALDGMISAQQVRSVLDEVMPYESWLAGRRAKVCRAAQGEQLPSNSTRPGVHVSSTTQGAPVEIRRR